MVYPALSVTSSMSGLRQGEADGIPPSEDEPTHTQEKKGTDRSTGGVGESAFGCGGGSVEKLSVNQEGHLLVGDPRVLYNSEEIPTQLEDGSFLHPWLPRGVHTRLLEYRWSKAGRTGNPATRRWERNSLMVVGPPVGPELKGKGWYRVGTTALWTKDPPFPGARYNNTMTKWGPVTPEDPPGDSSPGA